MGALTEHVRSSAKSPPLSSHSSSNKGSKSRGRFVSQRLETEERRKYKRSMLTTPDQIPWSQKKKQRLGSPPARSHQSLLLPRFEPATSAANLLSPRRQFSPVTVIRTLESFPIPSPLRRTVQGPQRPQQHSRMFSAPKQLVERVLEAQDLEDESRVWSKLEEQWNPKPRLFEESSNLNDLEDYKWRVSILQRKFDYAKKNDNGGNGVFTRQAGLQITPSSSSTITALDNDGNGVFTRQGGLQIIPSSSSTIIALDNGGNGVFAQQGERQIIPSSSSTITALGNGGNEVFTRQEGLQIIPSSSSRITALVDAERGTEATSGHDREAKLDDGNEAKAGSSQPQYKKLFEKAKGKDFHLKRIDLEVQLTTAKLAALQFTGKELFKNKDKEAEVAEQKRQALEEAFAPLNDDDEADVSRALKGRNRKEVLVMHEHSNIEITREILQCLQPGGWLNDEVINLYLELLKEREKREPNKFLKCHFFNTFFYKKLYNPNTNYGYKAVRRWTTQRKIGYSLIDCEKIFVPIHKEIHWCLAIIDMKAKKFQYLDSLKGSDANVLNVLARYITDEAKDKTGQDLDVSSWEIELVEDLPQQENGSDCGMFMIKYADFHSRGLPLSFYQVHMPYFRKRTAKEILRLKAD